MTNLGLYSAISPNFYANKMHLSKKQNVSSPVESEQLSPKPKKSKTSSMLPLIAGGAIAAGLLLVGLAAKKKISSAAINNITKPNVDVWKNLKFKQANTMEEAAFYAQNTLGIKNFNLENDLSTANWVNEGLTNLKNMYKGKFKMPDTVRFLTDKNMKDTPMAVLYPNKSNVAELVINKDWLKSDESLNHINETLKWMIEDKRGIGFKDGKYKFAKIGRERYQQLFDDLTALKLGTKTFSNIEINAMARGVDDYCHFVHYENVIKEAIENLFKDSKKLETVKAKIPDFPSLDKIKKMNNSEMNELADAIYDAGVNIDTAYGVHHFNKFDLLYHEGAHLMHKELIPDKFFKYHNSNSSKIKSEELLEFLNNSEKQDLAQRISTYAKHSPLEFVAETHIGLCNGYKFPDEIIAMYKAYGGPIPHAF